MPSSGPSPGWPATSMCPTLGTPCGPGGPRRRRASRRPSEATRGAPTSAGWRRGRSRFRRHPARPAPLGRIGRTSPPSWSSRAGTTKTGESAAPPVARQVRRRTRATRVGSRPRRRRRSLRGRRRAESAASQAHRWTAVWHQGHVPPTTSAAPAARQPRPPRQRPQSHLAAWRGMAPHSCPRPRRTGCRHRPPLRCWTRCTRPRPCRLRRLHEPARADPRQNGDPRGARGPAPSK
mmetsp:Transcript_18299/g.52256  ORF Transcript_18299/g.52256 Transcript_18299/m.52256 type:complete len:235 (+) Transcript_18299:428-1132(+)